MLNNSNQPYLYEFDSDKLLLYCYSASISSLYFGNEYFIKPWKIYLYNFTSSNIKSVETISYYENYGDVVVECNPHLIKHDAKYYLYYNAGFNNGKNTPIVYYLCRVEVSDPYLTKIDHDTFSVLHRCFSASPISISQIISVDHQNSSYLNIYDLTHSRFIKSVKLIDYNIHNILKVTKVFNQDKYIVVTSSKDHNSFSSHVLDKNFNYLYELCDPCGNSIYKSSILNGTTLAYTLRIQDGSIENRQIVICSLY